MAVVDYLNFSFVFNNIYSFLLNDFDNFGTDSYRFCDFETIKAILEFVRCTVFEIFEMKDHLWAYQSLVINA
ncbi:hypothetical protein BLOT_014666 [Blomia tropicalis]|nr:hypothetical protein BLOT_014666 [Blomia tropicalis]